jgi:hypothetical protein
MPPFNGGELLSRVAKADSLLTSWFFLQGAHSKNPAE